jgi:hypothetical protein
MQQMIRRSNKTFVAIIIMWVVITLANHYFVPDFFAFFIWVAMFLLLACLSVVQVIACIRERNSLTRSRLNKVVVSLLFLLLTIPPPIVNRVIEKVDWRLLQNKRAAVVQLVRQGKLRPNVSWNPRLCELPFEFPVVSNEGNDIEIYRDTAKGTITVAFWISRNFFDVPSPMFVFTDDPATINRIERQIHFSPEKNWNIRAQWYRVHDFR